MAAKTFLRLATLQAGARRPRASKYCDESSANIGKCRGNINSAKPCPATNACSQSSEKAGYASVQDFIAEGIAPETLARLVSDEAVARPARGLYQLPLPPGHAAHMLAEAVILVPRGVICLISALQFHELTLQTPSAVWMAIERTAWRPKIEYPPIRFVRFSRSALTEGVARHRIGKVEVPITTSARTVVDCFRYRNKIGLDVALQGLREGLRLRRFSPDDLWRYASKARVWSVMQSYIEAMVAQ